MKAIFAAAAAVALVLLSGTALADERASVSTDRSIYTIGETVTVTVTNERNDPIPLEAYWIEDSDGQVIYQPPMPCFLEYLGPGEQFISSWNQVDETGNQVQAGMYTVNIDQGSVAIQILADTVSLATDKAVYTTGEDVIVTITNFGDGCAPVCGGYYVVDQSGSTVYEQITLAFMPLILPGESVEYVWTQTDTLGFNVPEGTYTIISGNDCVTITIVPDIFEPASESSPSHGIVSIDPAHNIADEEGPSPPKKHKNSMF